MEACVSSMQWAHRANTRNWQHQFSVKSFWRINFWMHHSSICPQWKRWHALHHWIGSTTSTWLLREKGFITTNVMLIWLALLQSVRKYLNIFVWSSNHLSCSVREAFGGKGDFSRILAHSWWMWNSLYHYSCIGYCIIWDWLHIRSLITNSLICFIEKRTFDKMSSNKCFFMSLRGAFGFALGNMHLQLSLV